MNKKQSLMAQANQLLQKVKELEVLERQKAGQLVLEMYEKHEIKDEGLRNMIAKIVGDPVTNLPETKKESPSANIDGEFIGAVKSE